MKIFTTTYINALSNENFDISVTLRTTVGPSCDVIQSNFVFPAGVDLHLPRVHIPLDTLRLSLTI